MAKEKTHYSSDDLQYMQSLSNAVLEKTTERSKKILWIMLLSVIWLILWANYAEIDELARGVGKVIPSKQVQVIQNLEGGIISEILVDEGERVDANQILVKIDDTKFSSSYGENRLRYSELKAKSIRLEAEATGKKFIVDKKTVKELAGSLEHEKALYNINKKQLKQSTNILQEQVNQRKNELREVRSKEAQLKRSYELIAEEVKITEPLVKNGLVSKVEFLQLSRQESAMRGDLDAVTISIPRIRSTINEAKNKIQETALEFQHQAKEQLNEVNGEIARILESGSALEDRVKRTLVRSPVNGVVKQLLVNTVNGVVQPGMDIIEIVPIQDKLLIETKIKPSDIAYLYPGQKAVVKFTAYDFAIYGGLSGKLTYISSDTIVDEEGETYYLVRIKTDENHLKKDGKTYEIMVGMVANVDIVTGKKTVMDFILKPILKVKQGALRER
ncbi:MAG: HlyD family type I secretion periplasmic adaptor subunit [Campylobacterota bacterium]|nr:HlyD family type I secretion periplasmic adaptor subunit [Campylobacterota bacterium]